MNSGNVGGLNQSSKMGHSPQVQQMMNHHHQLQQQQQQMHMHPQQSHHHMQHPMGTNPSGMSNNMGMNHMASAGQQQQQQQQQTSQQQQQAMNSYSMNNLAATGQPLQMAPMQGGLYDHHQHHNMNGMTGQLQNPMAAGGTPKVNEQLVYLGGGQHVIPQNQYMTTPMTRNSMGVSGNDFVVLFKQERIVWFFV